MNKSKRKKSTWKTNWISSAIVSTLTLLITGCSDGRDTEFKKLWEQREMAAGKAIEFFEEEALPLGQAIESGDLERIREICDSGIELNTLHKQDMTFLHFALLQKKEAVIKLLVEQGASPHIDLEDIGTVLSCAILAKDTKFLIALLEAGTDANSKNKWGRPLFFKAAVKDDLAALKLLVEHGADLNLTGETGETVVLHAFLSLCYDQVEYLIEQGVNVEAPTDRGVTLAYAMDVEWNQQKVNPTTAAYKKLAELRKLMMDRGVKFPATPPAALRSN